MVSVACLTIIQSKDTFEVHSDSTPSARSSQRIEAIRARVLRFFRADPAEFDLIFVPNATAAIKLVMESFRDLAAASGQRNLPGQFWYGYHGDSHTSVVGVRETTNGLHHCFETDDEVEQWLDGRVDSGCMPGQLGLFAYPGQSNMTGRRLPLNWPGRLRQGAQGNYIYSLFDAAALATTTRLDLGNVQTAPDFTALSFYKIFGFPNLGALIVRKNSGHILQWRKYFGGGTVDMVVCMKEAWHARKDYTSDDHYALHDQLEDGTLPFHAIFALDVALDVHARLYGSMQRISSHTTYLAKRVYEGLLSVKHHNGVPVCRIYKESSATYGESRTQGATIAFNIQEPDRRLIPYSQVEKLANEHSLYVRSGGLCNPGGIAAYLDLEPWEMKRAYSAGHRCGHPTNIVSGKPTGVVRVSLGAMSTKSDVDKFLDFVRRTFAVVGVLNTTRYTSANSMSTMEQEQFNISIPVDLFTQPRLEDFQSFVYQGEQQQNIITTRQRSLESLSSPSSLIMVPVIDSTPEQPRPAGRPRDIRKTKTWTKSLSRLEKSR